MHLMFGAPGRYIQGPGVISETGACIAQCGRSAVVVSDAFVIGLIQETVTRSCKQAGVDVTFLELSGEVTADGIERLQSTFGDAKADVVVGAGGGKGIDAGKALAHARGGALITLPTVASNDAPTSKNYVVYDDHHQLVHVGHLPVSPRYVIVDTALIAKAPRQFLAMGIADGLTKTFEAEQCLKSGGPNMFGARPSLAGVALARECYSVLRAHSAEALAVAGSGQPNDAFERVVEAALLMSGLGFESGGLSIAHAMTRGLSRVPGPREAVHGWQVAYGLLVQLVLERRDAAFMSDLLAFYDVVGLPKSLADLKVAEVTDEVLARIAEPSLAAPLARNFERQLSIDDMITAMKSLETLTSKRGAPGLTGSSWPPARTETRMALPKGPSEQRGQNDFTPTPETVAMLTERAKFVRLETIRLIEIAKTGHYTSAFSAAEIFAALFYDVMILRRGEPKWPGRDRFLMGKGHAAVGLFPILADLGCFPKAWLDEYTRLGSPLGDHPDMRKVPGIDFSSGSIGHALSGGLGMCLAQRYTGESYTVFALLGDGEMQEGQVWEAALSAAHHKAARLIAIIDRNGFQLDGKVDDVIGIEPLDEKWRAFGWDVHSVNGHDVAALTEVLRRVKADTTRERPACIIANTVKGKGVSYMETEPGWHLGYLDPEDAKRAVAEIQAKEIA